MKALIGLAGKAGSGKDTVADFLCAADDFKKFSFGDTLYEEVADAFGVTIASLQDRSQKEVPTPDLARWNCKDSQFQMLLKALYQMEDDRPLSPRFILQTWGTEYRRAQDSDYWLNTTAALLMKFPERDRWVNTSVRFPNEAAWIRKMGGVVWHIDRPGAGLSEQHVSEIGVKKMTGDIVLHNDGTLDDLAELVRTARIMQFPNPVVGGTA